MSKNFRVYLRAELKRISKRERISKDKAFLFWFAMNILELSEDEAREAIAIDGANDKGIDLFYVDEEDGRIIVMQGKRSPNLTYRPKLGEVTKLESSLNWLVNPEALRRDGKVDLAEAAEDYLRSVNDGFGVELWFAYAGPKCANVDKHVRVYNQNQENVAKQRTMRHYHLDIMASAWNETQGTQQRIPSETIRIVGNEALSVDGHFGKALVVTVPAAELMSLHKKYEERLFDRNVRLFLGVRKGSVNAGIAETLGNKTQRGNFWAFNNGITIICDSYKRRQSDVALSNFSIINGCQTVVSLSQQLKTEAPEVNVLVRCVAASRGIVDDVIRFNNSQSPVRTWDIASQDKTQRRLKAEFQQLEKPCIYMTRRGSRPKGDLTQYRRDDGKLRQISIDLMGQYAMAFRGRPVIAYKHKAFIFSKYHDEAFPPDVRVEEVLFQWTCGEACRASIQTAIASGKHEEIRVLKKGGTLFVLGTMGKILSLRNGATYSQALKEESISSVSSHKRLAKYADYARDRYVQAVVDQEDVDKVELPTLIRSPEFYARVLGRVERTFASDSRAEKWLKEALPKIQ